MTRLTGVQPADPALFHARKDGTDRRLGEHVRRDDAGYAGAAVAILGCPQDEGVRRNGGRPGAAQAPAEIRRALYRLTVQGLEDLAVFDAGDVVPAASLEETHAALESAVRQLLADGKRVIVLGGGNDISYPDCAALAKEAGGVLAFNVDAHLDVRPDQPRNSGTAYRQLLEERLLEPARFHELGAQAFCTSAEHARWLTGQGVRIHGLDDLRRKGIGRIVRRALRESGDAATVFWGVDLDVVNASEAPGVSAPNPLGLSGRELCELAGEPRTRVVEFSEVNPVFDLDARTSRLAATAAWHCLATMAERAR